MARGGCRWLWGGELGAWGSLVFSGSRRCLVSAHTLFDITWLLTRIETQVARILFTCTPFVLLRYDAHIVCCAGLFQAVLQKIIALFDCDSFGPGFTILASLHGVAWQGAGEQQSYNV